MSDVRLHLGDCLEFMRGLPDGSVDAVVTDPPYNVGLKYSDGDNRSDYPEWCLAWFSECVRVSRFIMLTPGIKNLWVYPPAEWVLCWNKMFSGTRGGKVAVVNRWEPVLVYGSPDKKLGGDVFDAMSDCYLSSHKGPLYDTGNHPCPKPLDLLSQLIDKACVASATIFDPFMGSGTTGVACVQTGRNFIGCEIDPNYYAIAQRRIEQAQQQLRLPEVES